MRNNSAQCAEDEREIKYFDFRTFGAAAPHLRRPRRAPEASIGRASAKTVPQARQGQPNSKLTTHNSQLKTYAHYARALREEKSTVDNRPALYACRVCTIYRGLFKYYIYIVYLIQK